MGLPLLSAFSPLLVLPVVARVAGASGFASIALGQAIGTIATTIVLFGWAVSGPARVARAQERAELYWLSFVMRCAVAFFVFPAVVVVSIVSAPAGQAELLVVSSLAFATAGLAPNWFFIGTGEPMKIAAYDGVPRMAANLVGAGIAWLTRDALYYSGTLLLVAVVASGVSAAALTRQVGSRRVPLRTLWSDICAQAPSAGTASTMSFYESAPLAVLGAMRSPVLIQFAPMDRLLKYGYIGVYAASAALQGWVAELTGTEARRRMHIALTFHGALGVLAGVAFATLAPVLDEIVFGQGFVIEPVAALWVGIGLAFMSMSTSMGLHVLTPLGHHDEYLRATLAGALLIVPVVFVLSARCGVTGVAIAIATVQICVAGLLGLATRRAMRSLVV
jgi:PST family polysaccharide transporter